MSLITPAEAQALGIGLSLSSADLQTVIDREEAEIVRLFGPNVADALMDETVKGGQPSIYLKRPIAEMFSVDERYFLGDTAPQTLTEGTDYYAWLDEGRLERILTAGRWGALVTVTYVPVDDTALRVSVLADLIRIATEQSASGSGGSVSGLGFSISGAAGSGAVGSFAAQRGAAYARLGWLSR